MVTNWYSLESKEILREFKTNENGSTLVANKIGDKFFGK